MTTLNIGRITQDPLWVEATFSPFTCVPGDSESHGALTATFSDGSTHTIPVSITNDIKHLSARQKGDLVEAKLINAVEAMRLFAKNC